MGILSRWRQVNSPRQWGSGKVWDNNNRGGVGNVGHSNTTLSGNATMPASTNFYQPGPNVEPYLQTREWKNPFRVRSQPIAMQPEIPTSEPWAVSSTYVQNVNTSTGQFKNQVQPGPFVGNIKAIAPPMTTQRELEWDAADSVRTLQRFHFITASQRYFNERVPLPEFTTPSVPAHSVITGNNDYYPSLMISGWRQNFIPEPVVRQAEFGAAPPWLLSTPLNVKQRTYSEYDTVRKPLKAKAPKRVKSGGS